MTDQELVEGCIKENRVCQEMLWKRYSQKLFALAMRYCQNQEEAEDALMEAFVKIYNHLGKFRFQSSLETWMRRVTVNVCINKIRARKMMFDSIDDYAIELPSQDHSLDNLHLEQLLKLVGLLPVGYRAVFNLYAIEGYSHKEIAETMGIDEGTSRSQFAKARKALQSMLAKLEGGQS
ncbi:MAG: RNA polymerase sigma factor [Bacteroidia bacterium]